MTVVPFAHSTPGSVTDGAERLDKARQRHIRNPQNRQAYIAYLEALNAFNSVMLRQETKRGDRLEAELRALRARRRG